MKKILLIALLLSIILSPALVYAKNNIANNIDKKDFKMKKMGKYVVKYHYYVSVFVRRIYDPQTNTMCYLIKSSSSRFNSSGVSCVYLGKKK